MTRQPRHKPAVLKVPASDITTYRPHLGEGLCGYDVTDLKLLKLHAERPDNKRRHKITTELRTICGNDAIVEMNSRPPTLWCAFCYELDSTMRTTRGMQGHLPAIGDALGERE